MNIHYRIEALAYHVNIVAICIADRLAVDGFDDLDRRYWTAAYIEATTNLRDTRALRDDLMAVSA